MSKKVIGFWYGRGVLGNGINYGDPILEGTVDTKTIEAQKKLGNIKTKEVSDEAAGKITAAETALKKATEEIKSLNELVSTQREEIAAKDKEISVLENESEESLKAKIKSLEAENKKLQKAAK